MDVLKNSAADLNANPANLLNVIEEMAAARPWLCERVDENTLQLHFSGEWCDYDLALNWWPDIACLNLTCLFGVHFTPAARGQVVDLIAQINQKLWIGHFGIYSDLSREESHIVFRHSHLFHIFADDHFSPMQHEAQCQTLIEASIAMSEKYVLPFQCVADRGRSARDAILLASRFDEGSA